MQPHACGLTFERGAGGGGAWSAARCEAGLRAPHTQGTLEQASISFSQHASDSTHTARPLPAVAVRFQIRLCFPLCTARGAGVALAVERLWEPFTRDHRARATGRTSSNHDVGSLPTSVWVTVTWARQPELEDVKEADAPLPDLAAPLAHLAAPPAAAAAPEAEPAAPAAEAAAPPAAAPPPPALAPAELTSAYRPAAPAAAQALKPAPAPAKGAWWSRGGGKPRCALAPGRAPAARALRCAALLHSCVEVQRPHMLRMRRVQQPAMPPTPAPALMHA